MFQLRSGGGGEGLRFKDIFDVRKSKKINFLTEHHLNVLDVDRGGLPVLGQLCGLGDGLLDEVVGDVQEEVLHVFVQLLVDVHLLDELLQAAAVQDLVGGRGQAVVRRGGGSRGGGRGGGGRGARLDLDLGRGRRGRDDGPIDRGDDRRGRGRQGAGRGGRGGGGSRGVGHDDWLLL